MVRLLTLVIVATFAVSFASAQTYPTVSIHDLQFCPADSLLKCDTLGVSAGLAGWTKQTSAYYLSHTGNVRDTVEIVGQVIIPPKVISFTGVGGPPSGAVPPWNGAGGYNIVLRDTGASSGLWGSIFVRTGTNLASGQTESAANWADTLALYQAGFLGLNAGDIVRMRGFVEEFPSASLASYTEFVPIAGGNFIATATMPNGPVEILGHKPVPPPTTIDAGVFMKGTFPSGKVMFSTGEPLEDSYVQLTNLKVASVVNVTNGTFSMIDINGNEIAMLDASTWFTLRGGRNSASTYTPPGVGSVIDTIRGIITTNSGSENARGYRISPCFIGDLVVGTVVYPAMSTHRRNPVLLSSADTSFISVKAFKQTGGKGLKTVLLHYSLNNGPWNLDTMVGPAADSTWAGRILPQSTNTYVKYFCTAADSLGTASIYASAAGGSVGADTSQGFFFYTVLNRPLTVHDVQYTPFSNGYSSVLGAVVTINGVVTADTSDLSLTSNGTTPWYIQDGIAPWNGIWVSGVDTILSPMHKGDSVSVTGTVQEYLNGTTGSVGRVTRVGNTTTMSILGSGKSLPNPLSLKTVAFNAANGSPLAEPYEGMLVRFDSVTVTDVAPTFADETEYVINDGSGPVIVRTRDGRGKYSNVPGDSVSGKTILKVGDKFSYMQGIIYFSFNQYKFVPRGSTDFGAYTRVGTAVPDDRNTLPRDFALSQNYPNPFNPSTRIDYDVPRSGMVTMKVYNILGKEVATLVNGSRAPGRYTVQFDAAHLATGMYIYRIQTASGVIAKKMLLVK